MNENVIDITVTPSSSGEPATIDWRPKTAAITVEGDVKTVAGDAAEIAVETVRPGVVKVTGEVAAGSPPTLVISQIPDPAAFARTAFIEALARAGVTVTAEAGGPNPTGILPDSGSYSDATKVAERISLPFSEYIKVILKVSYNRGADLMVCLAAVKAGSRDCTAGIKQELDLLSRMGLDTTGTYIFDGAGSDDHGKTTTADETPGPGEDHCRALGRRISPWPRNPRRRRDPGDQRRRHACRRSHLHQGRRPSFSDPRRIPGRAPCKDPGRLHRRQERPAVGLRDLPQQRPLCEVRGFCRGGR